MKAAKYLFFLMLFLFVPGIVFAADHYVRDGAMGANDGTDWTNAYTKLPSSLVRGDTYYVADGSYGSYTFDDSESGSSIITIKKAIESDHGTSAGWSSVYGDGQAIFGRFTFNNGYYVIDGQVRTGWETGHGFKIQQNGQTEGIYLSGDTSANDNITIRYVEMQGPGVNTGAYPACDARGIQVDAGRGGDNVTVEYCYIHDWSSVGVRWGHGGSNTLFQYNVISYVADNQCHEDLFKSYGGQGIIRYNIMYNQGDGGGGIAFNAVGGQGATWDIYGNLLYNTGSYRTKGKCISTQGSSVGSHSINVYNNTCIDFLNPFYIQAGSGYTVKGDARNNIIYNSGDFNGSYNPSVSFGGLSHDYNWFTSTYFDSGEAHDVRSAQSPFLDESANNYQLVSDIAKGDSSVGTEFDRDMNGCLRGADGTWDMGAYEFDTACSAGARPSAPTNLMIVVQ